MRKKTNQYTLVANDIETIKRKINDNNNIVAASKNPKDQCYSACTYIYQLFKKENVKLTFILLLYWEKKANDDVPMDHYVAVFDIDGYQFVVDPTIKQMVDKSKHVKNILNILNVTKPNDKNIFYGEIEQWKKKMRHAIGSSKHTIRYREFETLRLAKITLDNHDHLSPEKFSGKSLKRNPLLSERSWFNSLTDKVTGV